MNVAIIPARGGSKRISRKNIKLFCDKPIIAYSISVAINSGLFDRIIVSTDDEEIAEIVRKYGAEVPFMRPVSLSDDYTGTIPVIRNAIEWFISQGDKPEMVCCIYATAPFLSAMDIQQGLKILIDTGSDYAFSVTSYPFPIQRAIRITPQGRVEMFNPTQFNTRSQDLEKAYHDAGQFYWGRAEAWLSEKIIFSPDSSPVLLSRHRVQDIDTLEDWRIAEIKYKALLTENDRDE